MRHWFAVLLALTLALSLTACAENAQETENNPSTEGQQEQSSGQEEAGASERPLYVFVGGQLVGSWEDGQWISAVSEEGNHPFTMAEILAEEGYYTYTQVDEDGTAASREDYLTQCSFYTYNQEGGLSGFSDEERDTAAMLDPFAVQVPEEQWEARTFQLPVELTGEAATLLVPNYSFYLKFGEEYPGLAVSRQLEQPEIQWAAGENVEASYAKLAEEALQDRGITGGWELKTARMTGQDGREEVYLFLNSDYDEGGYWTAGPDEGGFFSLVLCCRDDMPAETVYEHVIPYTEDVTETFRIFPIGIWDLNGDGQAEVCQRDSRWEWGYYYVMARGEGGVWQTVLQANNGM